MAFQDTYIGILQKLPSVASPIKKLTFKDKMKWTTIILLIYFVLAQISVYGIESTSYEYFQYLEILLGSKFGSLVTLGIGPIVTASILLQLLVGSKIINWNLREDRGRTLFQGTQKLLAIGLSIAEAIVFVSLGAIPAMPGMELMVILQLAMGGVLILFMDELISRWGFGSGIGLFIVAGVASTIVIRTFNPLAVDAVTGLAVWPSVGNPPSGAIPGAITAMAEGQMFGALLLLLPVIATILVFLLVVYAQAIRVEIPLAFGSVRGFGRRWPLKFFYTSNIPVILIAALLANVQMMGRMLAEQGSTWLGTFDPSGNPTGGIVFFFIPPRTEAIAGFMVSIGLFVLLGMLLMFLMKRGNWKIGALFGILGGIFWWGLMSSAGMTALISVSGPDLLRIGTYSLFMIVGSIIFSKFWVITAGMDSKAVAEQIQSTGMQIPGFRRDIRIIERVLERYIPVLAVLGGAAVGALAAYADFTLAFGTGTGILLAAIIIYQLYEEIAMQHMEDMHPALRKVLGK
jgi:preprotein translocase subunit SecY